VYPLPRHAHEERRAETIRTATLTGFARCLAMPGVGFDQRTDPTPGEPLDLLCVPEPRVSKRHLNTVCNTSLLKLLVCLLDQRLERDPLIPTRDHIGGNHDLIFRGDRLGGVPLQEPAAALHHPRVRIGDIDRPSRSLRRRIRAGGRRTPSCAPRPR
jgi:hypothetical protein